MLNVLTVLPYHEISSYRTAWNHSIDMSGSITLLFFILFIIACALFVTRHTRNRTICFVLSIVLLICSVVGLGNNMGTNENGAYPYIQKRVSFGYTLYSQPNFILGTTKHYHIVKQRLPHEWRLAYQNNKKMTALAKHASTSYSDYQNYAMHNHGVSKYEARARSDQSWLNWVKPQLKRVHYRMPDFYDYL